MSDGTRYDDAVMQGAFESGREVGEQAGFERGVQAERAKLPTIINTAFQDGVQAERERWETKPLIAPLANALIDRGRAEERAARTCVGWYWPGRELGYVTLVEQAGRNHSDAKMTELGYQRMWVEA